MVNRDEKACTIYPLPFVPRLLWHASPRLRRGSTAEHLSIDGSLVLLDLVGFTPLTERYSSGGRARTEELGRVIDHVFSRLLDDAARLGGDLVSFGGDALLLLFTGDAHIMRAASAAVRMRTELDAASASAGLRLASSIGLHTARDLDAVVVGVSHRELMVCGPHASRVVEMQQLAPKGAIVASPEAAALLPREVLQVSRDGTARVIDVATHEGVTLESPPRATRTLQTFVPVALRAHLRRGAPTEHRQVVVGCLRYRGSDSARNQDPDALAARVHALITQIQHAADDESVFYLKSDLANDGGLVMLIAGAPAAREHDALGMARALTRVLHADLDLEVSGGLTRGVTFAGPIGPPTRRLYRVLGDTVNLAARLANAAPAGSCYLHDAVRGAITDHFKARRVGVLTVKGKRAPVPTFVLGPEHGVTRHRRARAATLIGREHELGRLRDAATSACRGSGRTVEISGPPGIGKTTLLDGAARTFAAQSAKTPMLTIDVRGDPARVTEPFAAVVPAARRAFGIPLGAHARGVAARLRQLTVDGALLAPLFGAHVKSERAVDHADDRFMAEARARAFVRLLEHTQRAVLIRADDVHALDGASAHLIAACCRAAATRPWLVLLARRDNGPKLDIDPDDEITLAPLDDGASRALAVRVRSDGVDDARLDALTARAGGNPLYLVELARTDAESVDELPDTLEAALVARMDACGPDVVAFLRDAAVLGSSFSPRMLTAGPGRRTAMRAAIDARLLEAPSHDELRFVSPVMRDAAYAAIPSRERRDRHAAAAVRLESLGSAPGLLAPHYLQGEKYLDAWRCGVAAGDAARNLYANTDALALYALATGAATHLPGLPTEELARVDESVGDVAERLGDYAKARASYRRARARAAGGHRPALLRKEGVVCEREGRYDLALRWYRRAANAIDDDDPTVAMEARADVANAIAGVRYRQGDLAECVQWCEHAIAEATGAGPAGRPELGHACFLLAGAYADLGDARAATFRSMAEAIFEELGDLEQLAIVANNSGVDTYYLGDWDGAVAHYERSQELFERTGDIVMAAAVRNNLGEIHSDRGLIADARACFVASLDDWTGIHYPFGIALATSNLGRLATRSRDYARACALLDDAARRFTALGSKPFALEAEARRAEALIRSGEAAQAAPQVTRLLERAGRDGATAYVVPLLQRLAGDARRAEGDEPGAQRHYAASAEEATRLGSMYELACTELAMAPPRSPAARTARAKLRAFGVRRAV